MYITAIYGSPRKNGNTDLLLQAFIRGAREVSTDPHEIYLCDYTFCPCIECGGCTKTGQCVIRDGMDSIYPHLRNADIVVLAAPVFFYGLNALAKAMVDRTQCFWAAKYLLNKNTRSRSGAKGKGILLSTGGSRGNKNFDGVLLTARYFFDALDMDFACHLTYGGIDEKGAIASHPTACNEAYCLAKKIVGVSFNHQT